VPLLFVFFVTRLAPKNVQYAIIDRLPNGEVAESTLVKPSPQNCPSIQYPMTWALFKY
jgi:hypothetical protein